RACAGPAHRWEERAKIGTYFDAPSHGFRHRLRPGCIARQPSTLLAQTMMRILTTLQGEEWSRAVQRATQHDFYFLPEYHALAERRGEGEARLFVYEQAGHTIALPLQIRALPDDPG